jgi:hypothetical protein
MNIIKVQYADGYEICRHERFIVLKQLLGRRSYTMLNYPKTSIFFGFLIR